MLVGHEVDLASVAIRVEGRDSTELHPRSECRPIVFGRQHDLVVIAEDRDQAASLRQIDQHVEHALRVEASINVIAQRDDRVIWLRIDGGKDRGQGVWSSRGCLRWRWCVAYGSVGQRSGRDMATERLGVRQNE